MAPLLKFCLCHHRLQQLTLILYLSISHLLLHFALADDSLVALLNGDFSQGPPVNDTLLEVEVVSLPGWQISGTVQYILAGGNISLPDNGRAVQLGRNGRISQAFAAEPGAAYSLTFTLASAGQNCSTVDFLSVAAPPASSAASFLLDQGYNDVTWETHAWGFIPVSSQTNLTFGNQLSQASPQQQDPNITCGPVVDTVFLKKLTTTTVSSSENLLMNGGFEEGPYLLSNSSYGVLLQDITNMSTSPLPGWTVGSTVRYIDSGHYFVPEGAAAVELVGGPNASLQQVVSSSKGAEYALSFALGDGKDLCQGNMSVQVVAGDGSTNFTHNSVGSGRYENYTMKFRAVSDTTNISFVNLLRNEEVNALFCGPVIDNVVLALSSSSRSLYSFTVTFLLFSIIAANFSVLSIW